MYYKTTIICLLVLFFIFTLYRGDRLIKARKKLNEKMEDKYGPMTEIIEDVVYQGGFPPMPKPARLNLGLTESELVLFDKEGNNGSIEYGTIRKVDKFTTKKVQKRKFGVIAYGPLALLLNAPTFRHFFVAEYIDINGEENNLVLTVKTKETADKLHQSVKACVKRMKKK
jgi:hypothetical protein